MRKSSLYILIVALLVTTLIFLFGRGQPNREIAREYIPVDEHETIDKIISLLSEKLTEQYRSEGRFLRDTHPKGDACVKARFTVELNLPDELRIGIFKGKGIGVTREERTYKAWIRFSNAADVVTSDTEKDFRGMAVKLFNVQGKRLTIPGDHEQFTQDFLFIAHDAFFAGTPLDFHDFFAAVVKGGGAGLNSPVIWYFLTHPRGFWNALKGRRVYASISDIQWFSVAPFLLAAEGSPPNAVKYSAKPCESQRKYEQPGETDDYLRERLKEELDPSKPGREPCLDFLVQFQVDANKQPIENTLIAWEEGDSPFRKVATITIPKQRFGSDEQNRFCENITYNPWHSLAEHRPLGGINRARRQVMPALQNLRLKLNGQQRFEPTGDETF